MNRKQFIRGGFAAGIGLAAGKIIASPTSKIVNSANDYFEPGELDLNEITIGQLQAKLGVGELTAAAATAWYLKRIEETDRNGPAINSVIEINPDAMQIAADMDAERKSGKTRGPLHGIPVLIKDNINTGDKMMTTAGALALVGNYASQDAFIIKKLRAAGAVLLGKTNLSEFANFRSTHSTSAWSSRGGQTKCPYVLNRNPSGSSSGSGSAVAANLCTIAIGTETDGSIVSPASVNSLVGIKPTVGLWSRSGIIPISATQDTAGPMCRTVKDAAILLSALAGIDQADPVTAQSKGKAHTDYTKFLDPAALKGKRLGVEKSFLKGNPDMVALLQKTIALLTSLGAVVIEIDVLKSLSQIGSAELTVLTYEFKDGLNKYLAPSKAPVKTLAEAIAFNNKNAEKAMPFFKQEILENAEKKGGLDAKEYKDALAKSLSSRKILDSIFSQHRLDAICGTTNGLACCIDIANGDYDTGFSFSSPAAMAGYPHITVPMGFIHELPVGFSFFSTAYNEAAIIGMAYAFEQATKARKVPGFLATVAR